MTLERLIFLYFVFFIPLLSILSFYGIPIYYPTASLLLIALLILTLYSLRLISYRINLGVVEFAFILALSLYFCGVQIILIDLLRPEDFYKFTSKDLMVNICSVLIIIFLGMNHKIIQNFIENDVIILKILFVLLVSLIVSNHFIYSERLINGGAHLFLSPSIVILGCLAVNTNSTVIVKFVLFSLGAACLYLLSGRGTVIAVTIGLASLLPNKLKLFLILLCTGLVVLVASDPSLLQNFSLFTLARSADANIAAGSVLNDVSAAGRLHFLLLGLQLLPDYYLLGAPRVWSINGTLAGYPHNIISFWLSYGIFPTAVLVFLILRVISRSFLRSVGLQEKRFRFMASYCVAEILLFKGCVLLSSYSLFLIPILWFILRPLPQFAKKRFSR